MFIVTELRETVKRTVLERKSEMFEAPDFSRLWRFVDDSLSPYTKVDLAWLSKEKEREILLVLSQVFRQVQLWNKEVDSASDNVSAAKLDSETEFSAQHRSNSKEIQSLSKIIVSLVHLMTVDSRYIRHLAGNVLIVISEFVAQCGSLWEAFIRFLFVSLNLALNTLIFDSLSRLSFGASDHNVIQLFVLALKDKMKNADWSALASLVRVLRCILKYLAIEDDAQRSSVYFDSVDSCLSNVDWDSFGKIFDASDNDAQKSLERFVFLGNFIQWLCSMVEQCGAEEASGGSPNKNPVFSLTVALVPKLLCWCHGEDGDSVNKCIVQYFRHKWLVLMFRFSFQTSLNCSILVSWLQLLGKYFGEILRQPITSLTLVHSESLEGSPFLSSISDEDLNSLSTLHIARRAIFLFLRCSFGLISSKCGTKCCCGTENQCYLSSISNVESECCGRERGLIELKNWFRWQKIYLEKGMDFSLSFLQLYMHEDDLLFKVLLQLLSVPFPSEKGSRDLPAFQDSECDILFCVSNVFNRVHLFHLFLSELHYDHQVLLDYLISKDTGTSCAEYLLRCLRAVCDSWHSFVEFVVHRELTYISSHKKRKAIQDYSAPQAEASMPEKDYISKTSGKKQYQPTERPYSKAKRCLLSLLLSVESLHQKNMFPYNPKVLLKRLRTFQELCRKEDQNY